MPRKSNSVIHECQHCQSPFKVSPMKAATGCGKFCTVECRILGGGYRPVVLAALPATTRQIIEKTGLDGILVRKILTRMYERGDAHPARLVDSERAPGRSVQKFEIVTEPRSSPDPDMPKCLFDARKYLVTKTMLDVMPGTLIQIIERTGFAAATCSIHIRRLHKEGKCHIVGWRRAKQGASVPRYRAGSGVDKPCNIVKLTQKERTERFLAKAHKTGRISEVRAAWCRNVKAQNARKNGDRLVAALFGKPNERNREAA